MGADLRISSWASGYWRLLVGLMVVGVAMPFLGASAYAQQDPYFDPSLGVGDSIIRSDVFVGDKQGRVTATEGLFTRQLSGWLSGDAEVLHGEVVHVGPGCNSNPYLADPAGKVSEAGVDGVRSLRPRRRWLEGRTVRPREAAKGCEEDL